MLLPLFILQGDLTDRPKTSTGDKKSCEKLTGIAEESRVASRADTAVPATAAPGKAAHAAAGRVAAAARPCGAGAARAPALHHARAAAARLLPARRAVAVRYVATLWGKRRWWLIRRGE